MPNEDKSIGGSSVLNLRIWWRHVKTLYTMRLLTYYLYHLRYDMITDATITYPTYKTNTGGRQSHIKRMGVLVGNFDNNP